MQTLDSHRRQTRLYCTSECAHANGSAPLCGDRQRVQRQSLCAVPSVLLVDSGDKPLHCVVIGRSVGCGHCWLSLALAASKHTAEKLVWFHSVCRCAPSDAHNPSATAVPGIRFQRYSQLAIRFGRRYVFLGTGAVYCSQLDSVFNCCSQAGFAS
jgi:hypothetical protein